MVNSPQEGRRLDVDWDSLFPTDSMKIGNADITIIPMGFGQLAKAITQLKLLASALAEQGISFDNYEESKNIAIIAAVVMEKAPDLLSEASDIHKDDLNRLPLEHVLNLITKVIEVNLVSKDSLLKNFEGLAGSLNSLIPSLSEK